MPFLFYDPTMLLLIPAIILAIWAQSLVKRTFAKYSKVGASTQMSGVEVARRLLEVNGLGGVLIEEVKGQLSDHYDPKSKTLRLSQNVAHSRSVAAISVAAHEVGHAIQHQKGWSAFQLRQSFFPVANIGSRLAFPLFIGGLFFAYEPLMDIGIILFSAAVAFQVITLPVEFDASKRALALLDSRGYLVQQEVGQARKVLNAAALTYVASTAVAVLHLLRLLILRGVRD
ncbi:zinc metallopeptidase [candidate division KSB1 bacterium]|nr:zinc metallopeptidase [candidate division KSB1 bacterium]